MKLTEEELREIVYELIHADFVELLAGGDVLMSVVTDYIHERYVTTSGDAKIVSYLIEQVVDYSDDEVQRLYNLVVTALREIVDRVVKRIVDGKLKNILYGLEVEE